jgi:hypothetical protein
MWSEQGFWSCQSNEENGKALELRSHSRPLIEDYWFEIKDNQKLQWVETNIEIGFAILDALHMFVESTQAKNFNIQNDRKVMKMPPFSGSDKLSHI